MTFLNPPMLAGLAAAVLPLVVHLLNRSRYRNVEWAAMMFLEGMAPRADHTARVKQWALLGMRCGGLGLLAFAMARPILYARGLPPQRPGRTAAVILLDRSSSMALNDNGRPRADQARDAVYQLLSPGFKRGDDLWLLPMGDGDPAAAPAYSTDPQEMARLVREVPPPSGLADVAGSLDRALDLLAGSGAPNREMYVVCDRQAQSWSGVDAAFARRWQDRLSGLAWRPRVTVVPVGTDEANYLAITSVRPLVEPLVAPAIGVAAQAAEVEVTIRNFGTIPRASMPVSVTVQRPNGRNRAEASKTISLPALASVSERFALTFPDAGSYALTAKLDTPGIAPDESLSRSVEVIPAVRVLLVDGDEREGEFQSASDFLRVALQPYHDPKRDPFAVDVLHQEMWGTTDLAAYRVLILADVATSSEAQARAIEQFAFDGGGVIVIPGDRSRTENYDAQLRWLPAALSPATAEGESGATEIGPLEPALGVARFFGGRSDVGPPVPVRRYFPATPRAGATVLGRFADGRPFIVAAPAGRGRVAVVTTPVDTDWNALPLTPLFLPLAQSLVSYSAGGASAWREAGTNVLTGEALVAHFDRIVDPKSLRLELPPGITPRPPTSPPLGVSTSPAGTDVTFIGAHWPGVYRLSVRGGAANDPEAVRFAVRTPPVESELTALTRARRVQLTDWLDAAWADPDRRPLPVAQESARAGWDLWVLGLGIVLGLGVVELFVTGRLAGRGVP